MLALLEFSQISSHLQQKYLHTEKVVGIMLADYTSKFVKEIIATCYTGWHIESGVDFDVFWPGYTHEIIWVNDARGLIYKRYGKKNTDFHGIPPQMGVPPLVNFNENISVEIACRMIEEDRCLFRQNIVDGKDVGYASPIYDAFNNPGGIRFLQAQYIQAKKHIRGELKYDRKQIISGMTLILSIYKNGAISFNKQDTLLVDLRTLNERPNQVDLTSETVSEIIAICSDVEEFKKIRKEVKKHTSDNKLTLMQAASLVGTGTAVAGTIGTLFL